jgi:hypothetical protein
MDGWMEILLGTYILRDIWGGRVWRGDRER